MNTGKDRTPIELEIGDIRIVEDTSDHGVFDLYEKDTGKLLSHSVRRVSDLCEIIGRMRGIDQLRGKQ